MAHAPNISVVMTVYNAKAYLSQSVKSVLEQTFTDFEFIIIDDASTDGSLEILHGFKDPRLRIHANPQNQGQTKSLNTGLQLAVGKYIARMDADDFAFKSWLSLMFKRMEQEATCAVLSPMAVQVNAYGRPIKVLNTPQDKEDIFLKSLLASPINHVGCMMRKEDILAAGGYPAGYKIVADYALWCILLRQGKQIVHQHDILVAVRVHEGSVSVLHANTRVAQEMAGVYAENLPFWIKKHIPHEDLMRVWSAYYAPHQLSLEDFIKAGGIIHAMYEALARDVKPFLDHMMAVLYFKRVWHQIGLVQDSQVRITAQDYIQRKGFTPVLAFIWACSFVPGGLHLAKRCFFFMQTLKSSIQVERVRHTL